MRIACLSGWGQPHDALESIAPGALHIDYGRHDSDNAALLDIAAHAREHDILIGWSLGGQLALRAIATGLLKPRALVLIAAPFQFVKKPELQVGMPADLFTTFKSNYERNPRATLEKAWELIARDDSNADDVRAKLAAHDKDEVVRNRWMSWLEILERYSCQNLHVEDVPDTLIIHGDKDAVVYPNQSQQMLTLLPRVKLEVFNGCGHAPHWHDAARVQALIAAHVKAHVLEGQAHG